MTDPVLGRIVDWAEADDAVRLVVLTSVRARPEGPPDDLSDYDVVLALSDLDHFDAGAAYRRPAARWGDDHDVHGIAVRFEGVFYEDGVKIDWMLWPATVPALVAAHGLPDNLGVGYRVLLDKDGSAAAWPPPSLCAHIPVPPTESEYVALVEEFWWSATYVVKARARNERFFMRYVLDVDLTYDVLRQMLEWFLETERGWSWRPGAYGRGLERELPPEFAEELDAAHDSFERTAALFRRVALEVGDVLGYPYPQRAEDAVTEYVERLRGRE